MDNMAHQIVDYALRSNYSELSEKTVHECKRRIIDTFASAIGSFDEKISGQVRAIAGRQIGTPGASVWGSTIRTTPEIAAFANGVMVRYLDVSDTYLGKGGSHPSDVISGVIAVGEAIRADGASVINAIVLAYDIYCTLNDAVDIGSKGWDQTLYAVLGTSLGVSRLLGLTRPQMGQAVSLALTPNMALRQTRQGDLSTWKGCAGANAARNAVFAAMLAQEGFTGPTDIFEGRQGLWNVLGRFSWSLPNPTDASHMIEKTHLKSLPICYHGQSAALCAISLRGQFRVEDILEISVESYRGAVAMMGGDASKWAPTTRETADHSLPYVIAIALLDGEITANSFVTERLTDPAVQALMRLIKISEDPELTTQYPGAAPARLKIRSVSGGEITQEMRYPDGHYRRPMSDEELEAKFHQLTKIHASEDRRKKLLYDLWNFEKITDVNNIIRMLSFQQ